MRSCWRKCFLILVGASTSHGAALPPSPHGEGELERRILLPRRSSASRSSHVRGRLHLRLQGCQVSSENTAALGTPHVAIIVGDLSQTCPMHQFWFRFDHWPHAPLHQAARWDSVDEAIQVLFSLSRLKGSLARTLPVVPSDVLAPAHPRSPPGRWRLHHGPPWRQPARGHASRTRPLRLRLSSRLCTFRTTSQRERERVRALSSNTFLHVPQSCRLRMIALSSSAGMGSPLAWTSKLLQRRAARSFCWRQYWGGGGGGLELRTRSPSASSFGSGRSLRFSFSAVSSRSS